MSSEPSAIHEQHRLAELRSSAKGWHGIQLAALGFIGLCGVVKPADSASPEGLQAMSGTLILVAFVAACLGILFVGKAAWPIYGAQAQPAIDGDGAAVDRASRQLRRGLVLTFVSIALVALATTSSWWPGDGTAGATTVEVQAANGQTVCGELAGSAQSGTLRVVTDAQPIELQLGQVASVRPVSGC